MKILRFMALGVLCASSLLWQSCSNDDGDLDHNDDGSKVELPASRMYILNQGSYNQNNAGIAFYAPKGGAEGIGDIFYTQNGVRLGDTAQDIIEHNGSVYVSVFGSNYVARLNAACVEQKRISFASDPELQGGVRSLAAEGKYVYATFYGGIVAKIDAESLAVVAKLKTPEGNLEGIVETGGKLYVANSYTQQYDPQTQYTNYVYNKDVYEIDLKSFTLKSTIKVSSNPNVLVEEDGKVFVISYGNYADEGYSLDMIDTRAGNAVSHLAAASDMAAGKDRIYLLYSVTDWATYTTTNTWFSYDVKSGRLDTSSFLKNMPEALGSGHVSMMSCDTSTGDIYIGLTNYTQANGEVYRFRADGSLVGSFDCGGQNPFRAIFLD